MTIAALVLAGLAAALHVFIFFLESVAWTGPRARRVFGMSEQQAVATREMAFNQGFYNLFLAIVTAVGIGFHLAAQPVIGATLILAGTLSMFAAALVLFFSSPDKRRAALTQGTLPLLAAAALITGLAI